MLHSYCNVTQTKTLRTMRTLTLAIVCFMLMGCEKETPISTSGLFEVEKSKPCAPQTVHYTALADLGSSSAGCSGRLPTLWQYCFAPTPVPCGPTQFSASAEVFLLCDHLDSLGVADLNNVTHAEQVAILNTLVSLANAALPACPGGGNMSLKDLKMCRDTNVPDGLCATAVYACCYNSGS